MSNDQQLQIGKISLALPFDHNLPPICLTYPQYASNLGRVAEAIEQTLGTLEVIDIGGNVGDSVAFIKSRCDAKILAIEGHAPYLAYLIKNVEKLDDVVVVSSFVAGLGDALAMSVSAVAGTARLSEAEAGDERVAQRSLSDILKEHSGFADAKLFKLDTDGMDVSIILASLDYVRRVRPVIFFEYDPALSAPPCTPANRVWNPIREIGYRYALIWENTGNYIGCLDLADPFVIEEIHAAASGWNTQRYFDICLIHRSDEAVAMQIRQGEVKYAYGSPRYGVDASAADDRPLHYRFGSRHLAMAFLRSIARRVKR